MDQEKRPVGRPRKYMDGVESDYYNRLNSTGKVKDKPETKEVFSRFKNALEYIVDSGMEKNLTQFALRHNIHYANFMEVLKNPNKRSLPFVYLVYLCRDYEVSAEWLLLGNGEMIKQNK